MREKSVRDLSEEELETYSRQIVLKDLGYKGQLKLRKAKICVIGLGGLGCTASIQLAAMGVGYLRLVDRDIVERSNLHRQYLYDVGSLGYPKVEVAAKKLDALNPDVEIEPLPLSLNEDNAADIIKGVDVVLDGLDGVEPRYAINRACVKLHIPYVFGAAIEVFGNVSTIIPGKTPCLECLYYDVRDEILPTCALVGVHPAVLGIVSSVEVSEAVRVINEEKPHLAGSLLFCDIRNMSFDRVPFSRRQDCPVCGLKPKGPPTPLKRNLIEEVCGRGGERVFLVTPRENLEIEMESLSRSLSDKGVDIKTKGNLGLTFSYHRKKIVSLLKSGIMITKGIGSREEALEIYKEIVVDGLSIQWSRVE